MADKKAAVALDKLFVREYDRKDGSIITINQSEIGDVGCVVWDAALVLSRYLETPDFDNGASLRGKQVVELGAGTGVVGLVAASFGADVLLTDLPEFVPLMELNIKANSTLLQGKTTASSLPWGQQDSKVMGRVWDYVLMADCIYYEESLEPLVETLTQLSSAGTEVLCCYEQRDTGNKPELERRFFQLVRERFYVEEIPREKQDPEYQSADIHIFKFTAKSARQESAGVEKT